MLLMPGMYIRACNQLLQKGLPAAFTEEKFVLLKCLQNTVFGITFVNFFFRGAHLQTLLAPVVQTLDSAIHWINHYPLDNSIGFASVYLLDSDLSGGQRYPSFEQLGPGGWVLWSLSPPD